nr:hypothetical protein [Actinokineospora bangkokensis]
MAAALAGSAPEVRTIPVRADLADLFPWGGLRRGGTVAVHGAALLLALLAEPTRAGSWAAVVGLPALGLVAAEEAGVRTDRVALVPSPGGDVGAVVAALLDGFDLVAVSASRVAEALARKLSARARSRGAVLLPLGGWPAAEVELRVDGDRWWGLGEGHGHLRGREVRVSATGRGAAARPVVRTVTLQGEPPPSRLTRPVFEHMFDPSTGVGPAEVRGGGAG